MTQTTCQNISQLPLPKAIGDKKPEFELPMFLLAAYRRKGGHTREPGYLVFTDLTPNRNTTVAGGILKSDKVPTEFRIIDGMMDGFLNIDEVFTVNVLCAKFPKVVGLLQQKAPQIIDQYDFHDKDKCNMTLEGLVALVKFTLKKYDGYIEATYTSIRIIDLENAPLWFPQGDLRLQELLNRFNTRSYIGVVEKLKENLDMKPTSLRRQVKTEKVLPERQDRRPEVLGAALLFGQNVSEEESSEDESSQTYDLSTQPLIQPLQQPVEEPSPQVVSLNPQLRKKHHTSNGQESPRKRQLTQPQVAVRATQPNGVYSSHCTLALLPPLPATRSDLGRLLVFVVDVTVLGMFPQAPFVIKPFNRTLKVAPLKLIVRDQSKQLELEFNTPKEICALVGCTEEEELYNLQFLKLQTLNRLSGTTRTFRMTVGSIKHRTGFSRLYWTGVMVHKN